MSAVIPEFNEEWRYEGWTNDETDGAYHGAVDSDGDFILAGVQGFEATSLSDDTFTSTLASGFMAVKLLGSSGAVEWYWGEQSIGYDVIDIIFGADTDSNNDVILAGSTTGFWTTFNTNGVRHIAVVKLDGSTGEEIWRFQDVAEDSSTSMGSYIHYGSSTAIGAAVDHDDNVFLVGGTYNSLVYGAGDPGDVDFFVMKLSGETGAQIFTTQGGLSYHWDVLHGVKADSAGDVVAAGTSGLEDQTDFLVIKLSGINGSLLWEYSPYSFTIDVFHAIEIDDEDDVYVAGGEDSQNRQGGIAESPVVTKLSGTDGSLIWTYSGTATSRTAFEGVAVDPTTGWVVGAGYTEGTWLTGAEQGGYDFAAVVLDSNTGEELARYQNGTDGGDYIQFAEFDSTGALFFGGYTAGISEDAEFLGLKFSPLAIAPTPAPSEFPTGVPVVPTPAPVVLTPAPVAPTPVPMAPSSAPVAPSPAPIAPTPAPVASTPEPTIRTPFPMAPTLPPVALTPAPVASTPAPVVTPVPVDPTLAPTVLTLAPISPTPGPIGRSPAPVAPSTAPMDPTLAIAPTPAPSESPTGIPVVPTPAPVVLTPAPVAPRAHSNWSMGLPE